MLSRLMLPAVALVLFCSFHAVAQESAKAKQEDSQMQKEHAAATQDHLSWQTKIMQRKAEHRSALAALAQLQADLMKHEAELEMMSLKVMTHQNEMAVHDHAIVNHEEHGKGEHHAELRKDHSEYMINHAKMKQEVNVTTSHHKELIDAIMQLIKKHKAKFYEQGMSDSTETRSIDSLNNEIANLKKTREFEKASWKKQLADLYSINEVAQLQLEDVSERFSEEQRRFHDSAVEVRRTNQNFADLTAELAKLNARLAKAEENKK